MLRVALTTKMLLPHGANRLWMKYSFLPQPSLIEQLLSPIFKLTLQPLPDGNTKPLFRAFHERARDVPIQQATQNKLTLATLHFKPHWHAPGEFGDARIQERHPRFETDAHGRPIDLGQNIVWQVAQCVDVHHPLRDIGDRRRSLDSQTRITLAANDKLFGMRPLRKQGLVKIAGRVCAQRTGKLMQLVARGTIRELGRQPPPQGANETIPLRRW